MLEVLGTYEEPLGPISEIRRIHWVPLSMSTLMHTNALGVTELVIVHVRSTTGR